MIFWIVLGIGILATVLAAWYQTDEWGAEEGVGAAFLGLICTGIAMIFAMMLVWLPWNANVEKVAEKYTLQDIDDSDEEAYVTVAYIEGSPVYGYIKDVNGTSLPESSTLAEIHQGGDSAYVQTVEMSLETWAWPWPLSKNSRLEIHVPKGGIVEGLQVG
jgi:hypothetical protein